MLNRQISPENLVLQAEAAEQAGQLSQALALASSACGVEDASLAVLASAARIAELAGEHGQAAVWHGRAHAILPSKNLKFAQAREMMRAGEHAGAELELRSALKRSPKEFQFLNLLGVVLKNAGRLDEALEWLAKAAKVNPSNNSPLVNMGNCHMALGAPAKAAACFQRAIKQQPAHPENYRLLGRALIEQNQTEKGIANFKAALQRGSRDPNVYMDLVFACYAKRQFDEALKTVDRALEIFPGNRNIARQRGSILRLLGRIEEARLAFIELLKSQPDDVETLVVLGNLHYAALDQREEANALFARALELDPGHVGAAASYCECLTSSRYGGNEMLHFQRAYEVACGLLDKVGNPLSVAGSLQSIFLRSADYERAARLGSNARLIAHWSSKMQISHLYNQLGRVDSIDDRINLLNGHRQWGDRLLEQVARDPITAQPPRARLPAEKIRIGFMSSDLRHHPVTYFALPILEGYDRERFELHCYSFYPRTPDPVQRRVAETVNGFRVLAGRSDKQIAQAIHDDGIDILFELGGTTSMNRVQVCAYKPAPVQVSWLGYPHSAGLSNIDYILVDPYNLPLSDDLLIEKPFLMPETWVTLGKLGFHDIAIEPGVPQDRQGCITFGTANNPYKYTRRCFAIWAEILNKVEGSRFLFVRPEGGAVVFRENVLRIFAEHGVAPERIVFEAVRGAHMPHYNRIDIALDPFPHVGGTTTCESIWMGVPVVTLAGPAFFERLSSSNLHNAGLGDLCASTTEEYVRIALQLAADRERRSFLRHGLRDQITAHPLGQPERFTRHFEQTVIRTLESH